MRAREARKARQRRLLMWAGAAVVAAGAVIAIVLAATSGGTPKPQPSTTQLKLGPLSALGTLKPAPSQGSNGFGRADRSRHGLTDQRHPLPDP